MTPTRIVTRDAGPTPGASIAAVAEDPYCADADPCFVRSTVGALAGAAIGGVGGAALLGGIGTFVTADNKFEDGYSVLVMSLAGAALGMTVGAPLGAHLGNQRRGSLLLDYLVPTLVTAGVGLAVPAVIVALPLTSAASAIVTEVASARARGP